MNLNKYLMFFLLVVVGCGNERPMIDDMRIVNNKYYYKKNPLSFTGIAISKSETGQISNEVNLKNGVPVGHWKTFGNNGEIVQSGTYQPFYLKSDNVEAIRGIQRVNVCNISEGGKNFIDLFIITNNSKGEIDKTKNKAYQALIDTLNANHIAVDVNRINKIRCVETEL